MDIKPPFDAVADSYGGQHKVTVRDGDNIEERFFASEEAAEQFRREAYASLKAKYAMKGL